jgi:hypothetical protein
MFTMIQGFKTILEACTNNHERNDRRNTCQDSLPKNTIVDLMTADHIRNFDWVAPRCMRISIEIFDMSQTIAAKFEVICVDPCAVVAQIESSFSRIGAPRITVRDKHLREGKSVERLSPIIVDIVDSKTFTIIKTNSHSPLLPNEKISLGFERRSLGLLNNIWLGCFPSFLDQIRVIFACGMELPPIKFLGHS